MKVWPPKYEKNSNSWKNIEEKLMTAASEESESYPPPSNHFIVWLNPHVSGVLIGSLMEYYRCN